MISTKKWKRALCYISLVDWPRVVSRTGKMERSWKTRKGWRREIIRTFHVTITVHQVRTRVWQLTLMYLKRGRKGNKYTVLPLPCISLGLDSYCLWAVLWIAGTILLTVSGFAPFILVPSGCRTKWVHARVSQCTMNVPTLSATGLQFFPRKLCSSPVTDIFQNLVPTHHTHVSEYPTVQNSTKKSIQERWRCTGEYCQLCYSHISQFKLSDNSAQQPRYSFSE